MRIKLILAAIITFLFVLNLNAQDSTVVADTSSAIKEYRKISQNAFKTGEKFTFQINYGFVTAGIAVMEILPDYTIVNGRKCYAIDVRVSSNPSFEWVYKFTEGLKSNIDAEGIFPWKFEQSIREPNYIKDYEAIFDQDNLKVKISQTVKGEMKPDEEYVLQKYAQDIISSFYYARTLDFSNSKEGDIISIPYFHKKSTVSLPIKFLGREEAETDAGKFKCIMLQPNVKEGDLASKADDIVVWLTDDAIKMPIKVQVSIIIGSVKVELTSYSGLAGNLNSKID
jgi:hypothetical protein